MRGICRIWSGQPGYREPRTDNIKERIQTFYDDHEIYPYLIMNKNTFDFINFDYAKIIVDDDIDDWNICIR